MAEERVQRRLAAILAADVVGYSSMIEADENGTLAALRKIWSETFNPVVAARHGRIVKMMGDGALIEFGSVVEAVECAVAIQKAIGERTDELRIEFRVGINLGEIVIEGDDIFGDGVNVAARLESQATPGGILVSDMVHAQVSGKIGVTFTDAGEIRLKNIERPLRVWRWDGDRRGPANWRASSPTGHEVMPSLAVLPFQNMSGDPQQEYFADGVVEDIITALSRFRYFAVIARNSSFAYKNRTVDVRQVSRELGVRYVLEGSVRRAGSRLRISTQLVDGATGVDLWAHNFDGAAEAVFDVQDRITESVVALGPKSTARAASGLRASMHTTSICRRCRRCTPRGPRPMCRRSSSWSGRSPSIRDLRWPWRGPLMPM